MLELLSQGASARDIAGKLGYKEGTMRVYLHNLYRAIGVRNKTEAVIWHLHRERSDAPAAAAPPLVAPLSLPRSRECFGDMALEEGLYAALGVMSSFLGPYGHMWEAGMKLKGSHADEAVLARRAQSRLLWRALLEGDFAYGKALHDEAAAERLLIEAPSDAVMLASLLLIGGYSAAADKLLAQLSIKRRGGTVVSARELALLRSLREALHANDATGVAALYTLASENTRTPILKQIAMVALYHAYKARKDAERARGTASAIWAEAEAARQELDAMGVRPLNRETPLPRPARSGAREVGATREKVTVAR